MGLTNLPTVGTTGDLGPVKRDRALQTPDPTRDVAADEWNVIAKAVEEVCAAVGLADGSTPGSLVAAGGGASPAPVLHSDPTYTVADADDKRSVLFLNACTVTLPSTGITVGTRVFLGNFSLGIVSVTSPGAITGHTTEIAPYQTLYVEYIGPGSWIAGATIAPPAHKLLASSTDLSAVHLGGVIRSSAAITLTIPELGLPSGEGGETVILHAGGGAITIATSGTAAFVGGADGNTVAKGDSAIIYHEGSNAWRRLPRVARASVGVSVLSSVNTDTLTHNQWHDVNSSSGAITITVSTGASNDEMRFRVTDITNPITLSASGVTIEYHGKNTIDTVGDLIFLDWWSSTEVVARITAKV